MCGLFLTVKLSCLFTAVAVLVCLRSLLIDNITTTVFEKDLIHALHAKI